MNDSSKKAILYVVAIAASTFLSHLFLPSNSEHDVVQHFFVLDFVGSLRRTALLVMFLFIAVIWAYLSACYNKSYFTLPVLILTYILFPVSAVVAIVIAGVAAWLEIPIIFFTRLVWLTLGIYFLLLFFIFRRGLSGVEKRSTFSFSLGPTTLACLALISVIWSVFHCHAEQCRVSQLESGLGEKVFSKVFDYVATSPVIRADIGELKAIEPDKRKASQVFAFLDYSAEVYLIVRGERGEGELALNIAGNSSSDLSHFQGEWIYNAQRKLIGIDGEIDYSRVRFEKLKSLEAEFAAAVESGDCSTLLKIVDDNRQASKSGDQYELDHKETSKHRAICLEKLGQVKEAAAEYGRYGFFAGPSPFRESSEDLEKIKLSRWSFQKALELDSQNIASENWQKSLEKLDIQQELTKDPCNKSLRDKLHAHLLTMRVNYKTRPECREVSK